MFFNVVHERTAFLCKNNVGFVAWVKVSLILYAKIHEPLFNTFLLNVFMGMANQKSQRT